MNEEYVGNYDLKMLRRSSFCREMISRHLHALEDSSNNPFDDVSVDIGQPVGPTGVGIGQALVIETKQVQNGGMQIVHMHTAVDSAVSNFGPSWCPPAPA